MPAAFVAATNAGAARGAGMTASVGRVVGTSPGTGWTAGFGPRNQEAPAATNIATMAKSKAACNPLVKGAAIRRGKKLCPVRVAALDAGSVLRVGPSRVSMGL
jgi:hypothetical protein